MRGSRYARRVGFGVLFFAIAANLASPSHAGIVNLGPAGDFNVFAINNDTQHGTDAEGRVAVGNIANFVFGGGGGYTIASSLGGSSTDNLIVGGNLSNIFNTLQGGVLVNGNVNWTTPTINGRLASNGNVTIPNSGGSLSGPVSVVGTYSAPGYFPSNSSTAFNPLPFSFSSVQSYLDAQSSNLASLPVNGSTAIVSQQVILTPNDLHATLVVYDVTGTQLANAAGHGMSITAPAGATVVVNVSGTADSLQNMQITLNGVNNQYVLYNFYQATSLTIASIAVEGALLAPLADIHFNSGNIDGTLIGNNIDGTGEAHLFPFQGTLPNVPEPSSIALAGCGAAACAAFWLRKRRRAA